MAISAKNWKSVHPRNGEMVMVETSLGELEIPPLNFGRAHGRTWAENYKF
jgi:hypothetical protein